MREHCPYLFFIDLDPNNNNSDLYEIKILIYSRVKVEDSKPFKDIIKCKRWQTFRHTAKYCTLPFGFCARYGEQQDCRKCSKPLDVSPKCFHCNEQHTANYRDYPIYKKLLSLRLLPNHKISFFDPVEWRTTVSNQLASRANQHTPFSSKIQPSQQVALFYSQLNPCSMSN